ncbi:hypothetical protein [Microbacterium aurugineum]
MAGTNRNLSDALRYREAVALFLNLSGHDDATARPMRRKVSESIGLSSSDVTGVHGWHIATTSRVTHRLSSDLSEAIELADEGEHVAVVQHLRARPLADSLVVMDLATFSDITAPSP